MPTDGRAFRSYPSLNGFALKLRCSAIKNGFINKRNIVLIPKNGHTSTGQRRHIEITAEVERLHKMRRF